VTALSANSWLHRPVNFLRVNGSSTIAPASIGDGIGIARCRHVRFSAIALRERRRAVGLSTNTVFNGGTSRMQGNLDSPKVNVAIFPSPLDFLPLMQSKTGHDAPFDLPVKVR